MTLPVRRLYVGSRRYQGKTANKEKSKQGLYDSDLTTSSASYILCKD